MALSPFPIDAELTAIAIGYKNPQYIADLVLPRVMRDTQQFKYTQYADDTYFNVPDTRVGRKGRPNQVELTGTEVSDFTFDEALDGGVPFADIANDEGGRVKRDPMGKQIVMLTELIALRREQRAAGLVFATGSYGAGLTTTLSGTSQWSDYANSDPVVAINTALDAPLLRPNQIVLGQSTWTTLRSHPKIVQATKGTAQVGGMASRQQVAELFEVDEVVVGSARSNTAARGQTMSLARLWGKHCSLLYKAPVELLEAGDTPTFGATFQWGDRIAGQWEDKNMGMRGGMACRIGESVKEKVVASQAGYFFQNAVA